MDSPQTRNVWESHEKGLVEIARDERVGADRRVGDDNLLVEVGVAVVWVPCDDVVVLRGRGQVEGSVAIKVSTHNRPHTDRIRVDEALDLAEPPPVHVDVHGDRVVTRRGRHQVEVAWRAQCTDNEATQHQQIKSNDGLAESVGTR